MMTTPSDDVCELARLMSLTTVSVRAVLAKAMGEMDGARQANAPPNATDHDSVTASSFCVRVRRPAVRAGTEVPEASAR